MTLADFGLTNDTPAAVRKPKLEIDFGSAGGPAGLAAGIALLDTSEDPWQRSVLSIHTQCGQAPQTDISKLVIANDQLAPEVALDDQGSIKLGYEDASVDAVMSGHIHRLNMDTLNTKTINVVNGGTLLSQLRLNQSYEQQAAGDVVSDLCSQAEVATDTVEAGIDLSFYVVDDRHNAYQHIHRLALLCGYVVYFTQAGEFYFGPEKAGSAVQAFSYSKDILELRIQQNSSAAVAVKIVGEGAAGTEGQDAWSWLIKDPSAVTAEAGEGKARLIRNGALRNLEGAQAMAEGFAQSTQARSLSGQIVTPGAPVVIVGSLIEISDAPADDMNGEFYVTQVSHRYDKREGFTSLIHFKQISAGGFSLGGLL